MVLEAQLSTRCRTGHDDHAPRSVPLLVSPSPRPIHQLALFELFHMVAPYVNQYRLGIAGWSPADLDLGLGDLFQPDLFVIPYPKRPAVRSWSEIGVPLLAVEMLSPS